MHSICHIFEILDKKDVQIDPALEQELVFALTEWNLENDQLSFDREYILSKLASLKLDWKAKNFENIPFIISLVKQNLARGSLGEEFYQLIEFIIAQGANPNIQSVSLSPAVLLHILMRHLDQPDTQLLEV